MKPTILIIDDEVKFAESLDKLLSSDYNVLCADNGRKGLKVLKKEEIDLVLLDYMLPDINGIKVLKEIRNKHPDIPVIMITGHGSKNLVLEAWEEKADCYIDKPFDIGTLLEKMEMYLW